MISRWMGCGAMLCAMLWAGCAKPPADGDAPIAAASPYLEAAARDVLGDHVPLVQLAGPSMCPGHFDLRPSQFGRLARCRLFLRFDFQSFLDGKLPEELRGGLKIQPIALPGGMCEPASYLAACRQIADACVALGALDRAAADGRLDATDRRLAALSDEVRRQIQQAGLAGAPVLSAAHQAAFCRWLGLEVAAVFSTGEKSPVGEIDRAVQKSASARVRAVVANLPEGRRLADALADRLDAPVVLFDNMPKTDRPAAFDRLVRRNLEALLEISTANGEKP